MSDTIDSSHLTYVMIFEISPFVYYITKPKKLCALQPLFILNSYRSDIVKFKLTKCSPRILSEYCKLNKINISSPILCFRKNKKKL